MAYQNIVPVKFGQAAVAASPTITTIYTVPGSTRALVKDIDIANTTAAAITIRLWLGSGTATSNAIFYDTSVSANSTLQWTGTQVLNATEAIKAQASATGLTVTASGAEAT